MSEDQTPQATAAAAPALPQRRLLMICAVFYIAIELLCVLMLGGVSNELVYRHLFNIALAGVLTFWFAKNGDKPWGMFKSVGIYFLSLLGVLLVSSGTLTSLLKATH